jgi:hypothetical protein
MSKEEFLQIASQQYDEWKRGESSSHSVGFYEFEKGFGSFMKRVGQEAFQASLGSGPGDRRKKNGSDQPR